MSRCHNKISPTTCDNINVIGLPIRPLLLLYHPSLRPNFSRYTRSSTLSNSLPDQPTNPSRIHINQPSYQCADQRPVEQHGFQFRDLCHHHPGAASHGGILRPCDGLPGFFLLPRHDYRMSHHGLLLCYWLRFRACYNLCTTASERARFDICASRLGCPLPLHRRPGFPRLLRSEGPRPLHRRSTIPHRRAR